ncbi:fasciculation and elongation protein zeta-2 isoform X1 [Patella vulgata]|uniref:fasciculation and elongation protein zeta-2 isoform X1 n=1 Tax=Patella vulgata TaxID=6465 RepID=UPI0021802E31|nr:fasciculation and elongation protein zeta-2 isoform X1 [Patella vulgata]
MIVPKMAELQFEAPLASFENEEWNEYNEFQTANKGENNSEMDNSTSASVCSDKNVNSQPENFAETFTGSLEDLVNSFDEKINNCFCNLEEQTDKFAPVQIRTQEEIMSDCQMWWTITGNFGNLLPIDWSTSYTRQLHTKVLNLGEKRGKDTVRPSPSNLWDYRPGPTSRMNGPRPQASKKKAPLCVQEQECQDLDLSDDEELAQAFDMHSLIINRLSDDDTIISADQVISEIETMMQETNIEDGPVELEETPEDLHYAEFKENLAKLPQYSEAEMKDMTSSQINEVLTEYELTIKELSGMLVHELALRDELEYDKELKNQFISLLLTIQKKRRDNNVDKKKRRSKTFSNNNNNGAVESPVNAHLTTVIPYHPNQGPPTSEQLQIYIKILQAINEDSSTVPTLLTDYILKVLCPT